MPCRLVTNVQELPLNMGSFVKDFAEQMFNHLSGAAISAGNSSQVTPFSSDRMMWSLMDNHIQFVVTAHAAPGNQAVAHAAVEAGRHASR